jgi:hypothetical protein
LTPKLEFERHQWLVDHEKRLEDALIAQYGIEDEEVHADGLHPRVYKRRDNK